jgi:hypothetical protein
MRIWKPYLYILFYVLLIDQLVFNFLLWKLPNESPWGTNHFFNFVYEYRSIKNKPKLKKRILVIGSSIAYYSVDRFELSKSISNSLNESVEVEYLSYAGMTPLDAYLLKNKILELKPDLIIYPLNFIDYRLHRAYVLNHSQTNEKANDKELLLDALNFGDAPQSKFVFPFETLKEFAFDLTYKRNSSYLVSSLFYFYRYREIYFQNLKNLYNHRFGKNLSYHGYAGIQIPERVNSLGWTGEEFSFFTKEYMYTKGFYIQIVPEILSKGFLDLNFYDEQNNLIQKESFTSSGWKKITLKEKVKFLKCKLSNTWIPFQATEDRFDYAREKMGIRLQQTFGLEYPQSEKHYLREERSEDLRFQNMSDSEYDEYFYFRLLSDVEKRPGIRYIWALKNAKDRISGESFRPTIHFQYLKKFTDEISKKEIPVLLVNHPENPISLSWYENSTWYKSHLEYLRTLENDSIKFVDWRNKLPRQDFSDFHHINFSAMNKLKVFYTEESIQILKKKSNK